MLNKGFLVSSQEPNKSNVLDANFAPFVHTASNPSSKLQHLYLLSTTYIKQGVSPTVALPFTIKNIS
jgi:hypothetical protein